jgi:hypothetical protein
MQTTRTTDIADIEAETFAQATAVSLRLPTNKYRQMRFGLALLLLAVTGSLWVGAIMIDLIDFPIGSMGTQMMRLAGALLVAVVIVLRLWPTTWRTHMPSSS